MKHFGLATNRWQLHAPGRKGQMGKLRSYVLVAGALLAPSTLTSCVPYSMGIFTPIPVPPWVTERMEEKYCFKNDFRTPIMPPIREGSPPPLCEDPPDQSMILR